MLAEFLKALLDLKRPDTVEIGSLVYSTSPHGGVVLVAPPLPDPIALTSLSGFVDAANAGVDGFNKELVAVHVDDYKTVKLVSLSANAYGKRQVFLKSEYEEYGNFQFGVYMEPEQFIISAQAGFVENENLDRLMTLVSALGVQNEVQTLDDGVTQTVVVKKGAVQRAATTVTPRWPLRARRTFTEAEQPETEFLLRMKGEDGKLPNIALFEVDGGAWKHDAMVNVSDYLRAALPDFTHLA